MIVNDACTIVQASFTIVTYDRQNIFYNTGHWLTHVETFDLEIRGDRIKVIDLLLFLKVKISFSLFFNF